MYIGTFILKQNDNKNSFKHLNMQKESSLDKKVKTKNQQFFLPKNYKRQRKE